MIKVLMLEDCERLRQKMARTLHRHFDDLEISGFDRAEDAFTYIEDQDEQIDIILTDLSVYGVYGQDPIRLLQTLHSLSPDSHIFVSSGISQSTIEDFIKKAQLDTDKVQALSKGVGVKSIIETIKNVLDGKTVDLIDQSSPVEQQWHDMLIRRQDRVLELQRQGIDPDVPTTEQGKRVKKLIKKPFDPNRSESIVDSLLSPK